MVQKALQIQTAKTWRQVRPGSWEKLGRNNSEMARLSEWKKPNSVLKCKKTTRPGFVVSMLGSVCGDTEAEPSSCG